MKKGYQSTNRSRIKPTVSSNPRTNDRNLTHREPMKDRCDPQEKSRSRIVEAPFESGKISSTSPPLVPLAAAPRATGRQPRAPRAGVRRRGRAPTERGPCGSVCQPPAAQVRAPAPSALCGAGPGARPEHRVQRASAGPPWRRSGKGRSRVGGLLSAAEAELAKGGRW